MNLEIKKKLLQMSSISYDSVKLELYLSPQRPNELWLSYELNAVQGPLLFLPSGPLQTAQFQKRWQKLKGSSKIMPLTWHGI